MLAAVRPGDTDHVAAPEIARHIRHTDGQQALAVTQGVAPRLRQRELTLYLKSPGQPLLAGGCRSAVCLEYRATRTSSKRVQWMIDLAARDDRRAPGMRRDACRLHLGRHTTATDIRSSLTRHRQQLAVMRRPPDMFGAWVLSRVLV